MKTITKISALLLVVSVTAALQAHATEYTESSPILDKEVASPDYYTGTFTESGLSPSFNINSDTISSAEIQLNMTNAENNPVYLTIDGVTQKMYDTTNPQTLTYDLTSVEISYITTEFGLSGKDFTYTVQADCELVSSELILNPASGQTQSAPDASSTLILLGGALSGLALLKRKLV